MGWWKDTDSAQESASGTPEAPEVAQWREELARHGRQIADETPAYTVWGALQTSSSPRQRRMPPAPTGDPALDAFAQIYHHGIPQQFQQRAGSTKNEIIRSLSAVTRRYREYTMEQTRAALLNKGVRRVEIPGMREKSKEKLLWFFLDPRRSSRKKRNS